MFCRLCLNTDIKLLNIFTNDEETNKSRISEIVEKFLHIDLKVDDELSNEICIDCFETLNAFEKFCVEILEKQETLKEWRKESMEDIIEEEDNDGGGNFDGDDDENGDEDEYASELQGSEEICTRSDELVNFEIAIMNSDSNPLPTMEESMNQTLEEPSEKISSITQGVNEFIRGHTMLSCDLCQRAHDTFKDLKRHFRTEHGRSGYATCCGVRFHRRFLLTDHLNLHENPDYFKYVERRCTTCNKSLQSRKSYNEHMDRMHMSDKDLIFECESCQKRFGKRYLLETHWNLAHAKTSKTVCHLCGKEFSCKKTLDTHVRTVHEDSPESSCQCKKCGRWLKNERSLYTHMLFHREEESGKQFCCKVCGARKSCRNALESHTRYHHPKSMHKCTICDKEFRRAINLKEHIATHTGENLYECTFCPQKFKAKGNMFAHRKKQHPQQWHEWKYPDPLKDNSNKEIVDRVEEEVEEKI